MVVVLPRGALASTEGAGTLGAAFLQIPVGAKAMTVPGIVAGMRPDASLIFSNPAALAQISTNQVYLTRANWLDDLSLNAVGLVFPLPKELNWSLGSRLLYSGDLKGYDASGQVVTEDSFYDLAFTTGLSRKFDGVGLGLGFGITYLREHLPQESGSGFVYSVGASWQRAGHRFEFAARDIGGELAFPGQAYPIDSRVSIGYGRSFRQGWGSLDVGTQLTVSRSEYQRLQVGASYLANPFLTFRTGFEHIFSAPPNSSMPISAGFGFHFSGATIDYAYTSQQYFSSTHTVSFAYSFGSGSNPEPKKPRGGNHWETTDEKAEPNKPLKPQNTRAEASNASGSGPATTYAVIAGVHTRMESAQAEARALRLLKIPAVLERSGRYLRVLIAKYDSLTDAQAAVAKFRKKGHVFTVVADNG
jgi:hypothetical protein